MEEDRLNKIESKYLYQEDSLERLSKELRKQQIDIQQIKDQIQSLKEALKENLSQEERHNDKPPHY